MTKDYNLKQVIIVRRDLNMRKGKLAAQVAHASTTITVEALAGSKGSWTNKVLNWFNTSQAKIVVGVDSEQELIDLYLRALDQGLITVLITDYGYTEFHGVPTKTCCAIGPELLTLIDPITGHLKLL